jgi:hypothetical protein
MKRNIRSVRERERERERERMSEPTQKCNYNQNSQEFENTQIK